ncbi:MAG: TonB C-terminal domain-containing protein [Myxococcota bacterium]
MYRKSAAPPTIAEQDARPPSMLVRRPPNPVALAGGAVTVVLVCVLTFLMAAVAIALAPTAEDLEAKAAPPEDPPEMQFIETRFAKVGRQLDPRQLPNRNVRARSSAPAPLAETPSKNMNRVNRERVNRPADSVEDLLQKIGTSADEAARVAERAQDEGDERGAAGGEDVAVDEAALYRQSLRVFFRRGFSFRGEATDLRCVTSIQISQAGVVESYTMRSSGNADFDQAVRLRLDQARGSSLPPPPNAEVRAQFFGRAFPFAFTPPR